MPRASQCQVIHSPASAGLFFVQNFWERVSEAGQQARRAKLVGCAREHASGRARSRGAVAPSARAWYAQPTLKRHQPPHTKRPARHPDGPRLRRNARAGTQAAARCREALPRIYPEDKSPPWGLTPVPPFILGISEVEYRAGALGCEECSNDSELCCSLCSSLFLLDVLAGGALSP